MKSRTPVTMISGPLGSGKTTLLRHVLDSVPLRLAFLMNEFGEIAIDSRVIEGKNVRLKELGGGCVCCSLIGEFEAAVNEIIDTVDPELIVLETTGVAEPDAIISDIQESLRRVRLDGVITIVDADAMVQYPQLGHTTRIQIEAADLILLNKIDLVTVGEVKEQEKKLAELVPGIPVVRTQRCRVDPTLLFGIFREREVQIRDHVHQPEFSSFSFRSHSILFRECFIDFVSRLGEGIYRVKGFVSFPEGSCLFNFVAGRWDLEPDDQEETLLVFIGKQAREEQASILARLRRCEMISRDPMSGRPAVP